MGWEEWAKDPASIFLGGGIDMVVVKDLFGFYMSSFISNGDQFIASRTGSISPTEAST